MTTTNTSPSWRSALVLPSNTEARQTCCSWRTRSRRAKTRENQHTRVDTIANDNNWSEEIDLKQHKRSQKPTGPTVEHMNFTRPSTELGAPPKRGYGEDDLILASGCCHRLIILKKTLEKKSKTRNTNPSRCEHCGCDISFLWFCWFEVNCEIFKS
jgi:hypothetical protein